ncbi:MAG TPA: SRPBCC domain-containing protein [Cryomorphaceae bacterium]|nr:polyketide cyclase [Owenweeksia sp.]MBG00251.1 polyketide cyclase [Owenweeksia sp.]HAD97993.1 SRPBCC domain-containing protein [Cryomorphaceae bacterium]HBF19247.1 SRPBCC domain-containing protein [Cryomorphaceae bacterium]HCQ16416.1 SRPBCC domain-containing protein [Cryomorphaceae bacterium]|tara:strand:+ start:569 stop:1009 length:441 start_codon:yes stop_codon:yes gene_type:complete
MKTIETSILIDAPAEKVWAVLTDFEKLSQWNPTIRAIKGKVEKGARLEAYLLLGEDKKPMKFKPVVLKSEKALEFRWLGSLFVRGLFDGEHYFILKPLDKNRTQFIQGEKFSGVLVGLLGKTLKQVPASFAKMNEALKRRVEGESS